VGTLRSLGARPSQPKRLLRRSRQGGYASEGSARRSLWRGATAVRPWGSTAEVDRGELNSGSHVVEKNSDLLVARWAASVITRNRSQGREIESRGIAAQDGFFVFLRQIVPLQKFVDLMPAFRRVENFVREVAAEE